MKGFHDDFKSIKDVPVATVVTAYRDNNGLIFILIIHEALYFGAQLDHSLINPNQIRHYGIPVSDDPYDSTQQFGINHPDVFIPFCTEGCTVFFDTFAPNGNEIDRNPHIILTDGEVQWDQNGVKMSSDRPYGDNTAQIAAVKRENARRRNVPVECDYNLVLGSISRSFVADDLYERLISSVRVG